MACAALEALLAKAIWVDLVGGKPPASVSVWLPDEGINSGLTFVITSGTANAPTAQCCARFIF
jgi:hypothetical protein